MQSRRCRSSGAPSSRAGWIDEMVRGPCGYVLKDLGIEPEDDDPLLAESQRRFDERQERFFPAEQREEILQGLERFKARTQTSLAPPAQTLQPARDPRKAAQEKVRKAKNKRKAQSASHKANRSKRK